MGTSPWIAFEGRGGQICGENPPNAGPTKEKRSSEAVTNRLLSAGADFVCSTAGLPVLPGQAFPWRRFAAEVGLPDRVLGVEFRHSL